MIHVTCAACRCSVLVGLCVPYGAVMVCEVCDKEMVEEDQRRYEADVEMEVAWATKDRY